MFSDPSTLARALLTAQSGEDAIRASASVADAVDAVWSKLASHFARLIGDAGVEAVLERSVAITSARLPWLVASPRPDRGTPLLGVAFEAQSVGAAIDGFGELVTMFIALLGRFIGDPLVQRALSEAWPTVFQIEPKESP